ncbi:hypothetical protein HOC01_00595 [archaeon]|jgi:hypothetical protein|nr:hypothetical protein [archaeon]MBT6698661.1 hypothetical protein [archaeon]
MATKQKIGKIQFYLGIILLVVTIIGSVVIFKGVLNSFADGVSSETSTWGEVSDKLGEGSPENEMISGIIVGDLVTQGLVVKASGFIFGTCTLILLIMSVMLILQGLTNQSKK